MISLFDQLMLRLNPRNIESLKHKKREAVRTNHIQCTRRNYYAHDYRTHKHFVELYQASLKEKKNLC